MSVRSVDSRRFRYPAVAVNRVPLYLKHAQSVHDFQKDYGSIALQQDTHQDSLARLFLTLVVSNQLTLEEARVCLLFLGEPGRIPVPAGFVLNAYEIMTTPPLLSFLQMECLIH